MKKERLFYLDFIRSISILSIVIYHINVYMTMHNIKGDYIFKISYANVDLGNIGVGLFFVISGAALMYTYEEKFFLKEYFKKRFLALYPMFWIAYSVTFLCLFYKYKSLNHSAPDWTFILTILGMDGYLSYFISDFYVLGEWFLGCIILLYLCFPILRKLVIKKPKILFSCICIFYIVFVQKYNFKMSIDHNFLIRIFDFLIGMYFVKYIKKVKKVEFILALIISMVIIFIPVKINKMYEITTIGISIFFVLVYIAQYIKSQQIKCIFEFISKYSYSIFLVHHVIINEVLSRFDGTVLSRSEMFCLFLINIIIISIVSVQIFKISNKIKRIVWNVKTKNIDENKVININVTAL